MVAPISDVTSGIILKGFRDCGLAARYKTGTAVSVPATPILTSGAGLAGVSLMGDLFGVTPDSKSFLAEACKLLIIFMLSWSERGFDPPTPLVPKQVPGVFCDASPAKESQASAHSCCVSSFSRSLNICRQRAVRHLLLHRLAGGVGALQVGKRHVQRLVSKPFP